MKGSLNTDADSGALLLFNAGPPDETNTFFSFRASGETSRLIWATVFAELSHRAFFFAGVRDFGGKRSGRARQESSIVQGRAFERSRSVGGIRVRGPSPNEIKFETNTVMLLLRRESSRPLTLEITFAGTHAGPFLIPRISGGDSFHFASAEKLRREGQTKSVLP